MTISLRDPVCWVALVVLAGCAGDDDVSPVDASIPIDAQVAIDAPPPIEIDAAVAPGGIAPEGDEIAGTDGANELALAPDAPAVVRVDAAPDEHVTFFLTFDGAGAGIELEVLRWDGERAVSLGVTDAGPGLRTLAVFDPSEPRTFWARVTSDARELSATLTITRVPFEDGARCDDDCAHLLQLPLPNDFARDGYATTTSTVFRYQYGRRDLLMFLRHAGQRLASLGMQPFVPEDLSQWDGRTPGEDVGAPRHASHQRGKDVDLSLYGLDGRSVWRSYCTVMRTDRGRECVPGTITGYDGFANAVFFGDFFATGRVTNCFLDQELIGPTVSGADEALTAELVAEDLLPMYADGAHLQHWPNHDNHIHVRVSEAEPSTFAIVVASDAVEPP
ncbi:hypothetical protein [Sandaracinus amylolyticus]|uniref:hypothetical protein n=1 Tax=Sandaracinus amylolyticus TaxID=927083 RepID=UPI001F2B98F9|nr:hypothetical protein [Sandaracinus amylolyticus]UJR83414.1 Hypothetical protein I5071_54820 [Sandaracinus amylolyticus]